MEAQGHKLGLPENCKIVLFSNNCSSNLDAEVIVTQNDFTAYLPQNSSSLIQPMDQGIICSMKCFYRNKFWRQFVNSSYDAGDDAIRRQFTIKDGIWAWLWDTVTLSALKNAWHNLWPMTMFGDSENADSSEGFNISSKKTQAPELKVRQGDRY